VRFDFGLFVFTRSSVPRNSTATITRGVRAMRWEGLKCGEGRNEQARGRWTGEEGGMGRTLARKNEKLQNANDGELKIGGTQRSLRFYFINGVQLPESSSSTPLRTTPGFDNTCKVGRRRERGNLCRMICDLSR